MTYSYGICLLNGAPYPQYMTFTTPRIKEWIHESFKNYEIMILDCQMKGMYCHDMNTFSKITVESLIQRPWKVNPQRKYIGHHVCRYFLSACKHHRFFFSSLTIQLFIRSISKSRQEKQHTFIELNKCNTSLHL